MPDAPDNPAFTFDRGSRRFRDASGRYVSPKLVRAGIDRLAAGAGAEVRAISERLQAGEINSAEWERSIRAVLRAAHLAAGGIAVGGKAGFDARAAGFVGNQLKVQYSYLRSLGREIEAGLPLDGRFLSRSAMYGQSARITYENINRERDIEAGYDRERRYIGGSNPCRGCIAEAAKGWKPAGVLKPLGSCQCLVSCHCRMDRKRSNTPSANPPVLPTSIGGKLPPVPFALSDRQRARRSVMVLADVAKLDRSLASDTGGFYVGRNGTGPSASPAKYRHAKAFIRDIAGSADPTASPVNPPDIALGPDGRAYLDDGRHRFAVLRDAGVKAVPVAVMPGDAKRFSKLYGAKAGKGAVTMSDTAMHDTAIPGTWGPLVAFGKGGGRSGGKSSGDAPTGTPAPATGTASPTVDHGTGKSSGKGKPKGSSKLHGAGNCGTGKGGFRPGNTCGKSGRAKLAETYRNARAAASHPDAHPDHARNLRLAARELRHHRRGKDGAIDRGAALAHTANLRAGKFPTPAGIHPEKVGKPGKSGKPVAVDHKPAVAAPRLSAKEIMREARRAARANDKAATDEIRKVAATGVGKTYLENSQARARQFGGREPHTLTRDEFLKGYGGADKPGPRRDEAIKEHDTWVKQARHHGRKVADTPVARVDHKPTTPPHTGLGSSQARHAPTDRGSHADRIAVAAARHKLKSKDLHAQSYDLLKRSGSDSVGPMGGFAPRGGGGRGAGLGGAPVSGIGHAAERTPEMRAMEARAKELTRRGRVHGARAERLDGIARAEKIEVQKAKVRERRAGKVDGKGVPASVKAAVAAKREVSSPVVHPTPKADPHAIARMPGVDTSNRKYLREAEKRQNYNAEHARDATKGTASNAEKYLDDVSRGFSETVGAGDHYVRVPSSVLPKVLGAGRFKTQFETRNSTGGYSKGNGPRREYEEYSFGIGHDEGHEKRPIYGYVSGRDFAHATTGHEGSVHQYGDVVVRLKPEIRDRSTVTLGDSLGNDTVGVPSRSPSHLGINTHKMDFAHSVFTDRTLDAHQKLAKIRDQVDYLEAQHHGGVSVKDIAEVGLPREPDAKLAKTLKAHGIPYRVLGDTTPGRSKS